MIVFGVGRLPEVFGSFGKGIREFRKAASGDDDTPAPSAPERPVASTASAPSAAPTTTNGTGESPKA
jgi:sec-independent protein translocase protein TatA